MTQPYVLQAAVNLARLARCDPRHRVVRLRRGAGRAVDGVAAPVASDRLAARAALYEEAVRDALRGLGASLRRRGVDALDVTSALRDIVRLVIQLSGLGDTSRAARIERQAVQWGIEGYNGHATA